METLEDFVALSAAYGPGEAQARVDEYRDACAAGRAEAERLMKLPPGRELLVGLEAIKQMTLDRASKVIVWICWQRFAADAEAQLASYVVTDEDADRQHHHELFL